MPCYPCVQCGRCSMTPQVSAVLVCVDCGAPAVPGQAACPVCGGRLELSGAMGAPVPPPPASGAGAGRGRKEQL